jgi:hypothetical protein
MVARVSDVVTDDGYVSVIIARHLHRAGQWDAALSMLGGDDPEQRATILVDRHWWRLDDPNTAQQAIEELDPSMPRTSLLLAQLAYIRLTFKLAARPGDQQRAETGFRTAARDDTYRGWGTFWLGLLADTVQQDKVRARYWYDDALSLARGDADLFLESYVLRHLAAHQRDPGEGELLLRRSLQLRAALAARPQVAEAQAALADALPGGSEKATLVEAARSAAIELDLGWLRDSLGVSGNGTPKKR